MCILLKIRASFALIYFIVTFSMFYSLSNKEDVKKRLDTLELNGVFLVTEFNFLANTAVGPPNNSCHINVY